MTALWEYEQRATRALGLPNRPPPEEGDLWYFPAGLALSPRHLAGETLALNSIWRRHHADLRHHAPVFVFEDVAVVDELTHLGEGDNDHQRRR